MSIQPVFLTVQKVAAALGIPERTVREWCKRGKFDAIRPGHSYLIRRTSFEAMLRGEERTATTAAA